MDDFVTSQRFFLLLVTLVSGYLLYLLGPILSPFLVGALLAYLTDPVADRLELAGVSRTNSVVIVFVFLITLSILLVLLLVPKLSHQVQVMILQVPSVIALFEDKALPAIQAYLGDDVSFGDLQSFKDLAASHWQKTGDIMAQVAAYITRSGLAIVGWLANLLLIPVVTFYLLRDWDVMIEKIGYLLPRNLEPTVSRWAKESDEVLGAFMKGQLLVMLVLGCVYAVGLWLIGLDLALLLGMLAGLASIVPYMGFIVGIIAAGIAAYLQFHDPMILLWVAAVFGVGQALEGMVLTPLLVGDKIGLHPVAVIFAIMAGGQLFGFVGVLIALPVAAVIMVFLRHLHHGYKNSHLYGTGMVKEITEDESLNVQDTEVNEQR
ncbi:AI-2E family transporter [Neptunomonas antarctica]|uniref:Predicted PurR-regulated permease PerM n=1 Tax=Neptunomonas antarctica TaxID=619304 RepID=A0A1N7LQB4_9GAMM|nr:AI-2E family transporter [Neptunomonas antarctica]SIS75959.1 Predicted PurR-regulated permease PerM [Neptunomonas antarctica]